MCNFVRLLIRSVHETFFHCSKNVILLYLSNMYYIFTGGVKNAIKKIICECILWICLRAVTFCQLMGQLPKERCEISWPFKRVSVNLTGHYTVKCLGHRSVKHSKTYAVFFVGMSTPTIHIEVVSDLSTERFLVAFYRFVSFRALPNTIFSDNATKFVGTSNWLSKMEIER